MRTTTFVDETQVSRLLRRHAEPAPKTCPGCGVTDATPQEDRVGLWHWPCHTREAWRRHKAASRRARVVGLALSAAVALGVVGTFIALILLDHPIATMALVGWAASLPLYAAHRRARERATAARMNLAPPRRPAGP